MYVPTTRRNVVGGLSDVAHRLNLKMGSKTKKTISYHQFRSRRQRTSDDDEEEDAQEKYHTTELEH